MGLILGQAHRSMSMSLKISDSGVVYLDMRTLNDSMVTLPHLFASMTSTGRTDGSHDNGSNHLRGVGD